tara:strand:+ start:304 stop:498 length:195 start_codon:yes stop_codon:yes gene_type:complete
MQEATTSNNSEYLPGFVNKRNTIKLKSNDKNEEFVDVKDWNDDSKKLQDRVNKSTTFKFSDEKV